MVRKSETTKMRQEQKITTMKKERGIGMNLHEIIQIEADRLEKEVRELETRLEKAPKGSLRCHKNGKSFRWYFIDEKDHRVKEKNAKRKYISKKTGRPLAEKLARKAYDKRKLAGCKKELTALKRYLNCSNSEIMPEQKYLCENSGFRELLISEMPLMNRELEEWRVADYLRNPFYPENLQICSSDGTMVRSKSEALIASGLASNGIPYRYECALELEGQTLYPDFTIRHPFTGKVFVWEHFGMVDQEEYLERTLKKLRVYLRNGFIPDINFIMTFETRQVPLGYDVVFRVIQDYFM